jgi:hypothetical protein|tara:strand:- start:42 stop:422 length:381 start_codon:yes stop_codon:yes gene_type:complete
MAHFAKLSLGSKVISVYVVANEVATTEQAGIDFLHKLYNYPFWKQTSYNTQCGVHLLGGIPLRKNYAGKGFTYDEDRDAFIPPKPYASWTLNESTCDWEPPVAKPDSESGERYKWNESTKSWDEIV